MANVIETLNQKVKQNRKQIKQNKKEHGYQNLSSWTRKFMGKPNDNVIVEGEEVTSMTEIKHCCSWKL